MMLTRRLLLGLIAAIAGVSHAQRVLRTIGLLVPWKESSAREVLADLEKETFALGYDKRRLNIVLRTADSVNSRLPALAEELVNLKVDLVVAAGTNAVVAVRRASSTIPIVFFGVSDPVASGLAESLARPGRNNTGLTNFSAGELSSKRVEFARQLLPGFTRAALLINPISATGDYEQFVRDAWDSFQYRLIVARASSLKELDAAFKEIMAFGAQLVFIQIDAFFGDVSAQIAELLLRNRLPSIFQHPGPVHAGGLMGFGADDENLMLRLAPYVHKILRGEKASDLPIQQPEKVSLAINLKTATAIGVTIPKILLLQADRLIQ